jgi:transcriptional regulator with XRE-family HTH domain
MTQGDLAAAIGYSVSFVSDLEQNRRLPSVAVVLQQFIPALGLQEEAGLATHLVELAALARGERPPPTVMVQRTAKLTITDAFTFRPSHLPAPPTALIGRDHEIKLLCNRLQGHIGCFLHHFFAQPRLHKHLIRNPASFGGGYDGGVEISAQTHIQRLRCKVCSLHRKYFFRIFHLIHKSRCIMGVNPCCQFFFCLEIGHFGHRHFHPFSTATIAGGTDVSRLASYRALSPRVNDHRLSGQRRIYSASGCNALAGARSFQADR